jgi:non-lysosomal glucosylceramidase
MKTLMMSTQVAFTISSLLLLLEPVFSSQDLFSALSSSTFYSNPSTVTSSQRFSYLTINAEYLEPENVTCAECGWSEGNYPYLYDVTNSPPSRECSPNAVTPGFDRPGDDYDSHPSDSYDACAAECCASDQCDAWVYVKTIQNDFGQCVTGGTCCFLKGGDPAVSPNNYPGGIWSGNNTRAGMSGQVVPPVGMRSSVPLGGLGAGAIELRSDGTFHECTIINQSPAGSAKFGVVADLLLAARVGTVAKAVRTHPPAYAPGVDAISYSGSYPMSKLTIQDAELGEASVYAYSKIVPGNTAESSLPAISFTMTVTNPSSTEPLNASFMLLFPFAAVNDCARNSKQATKTSSAASQSACQQTCAADPTCSSWTFSSVSGVCTTAPDVPHSVYARGSYCGVGGNGFTSTGLSLRLDSNPSGGLGGSSNGGFTIKPVLSNNDYSASFATGNDAAALFDAFAASGSVGGSSTSSSIFTNVVSTLGAASVSYPLVPGESATLTLVMSWYFPDRDHMGVNIGNYYSTLWEGSDFIASLLATDESQVQVVNDINALHNVFAPSTFGSNSGLPEWVSDFAINQMSHFRGMIFTRDGRMREYEANDCPDVDSIHNDFQRHLPYRWLFPEFEISKMRKWAEGQTACGGCIYEYLGSFGLGPLDIPGGRIMGDTTTLWVTEVMEVWHNTGDEDLLMELYPYVQIATRWAIKQTSTLSLPLHLVCTYDILELERYNTTTYNSFLYLLMLNAATEMATHLGDTQLVTDATNAINLANAAIKNLLWNSSDQYFRAYTGEDAVMTDSLYGAMIGHHNGLGILWSSPTDMLNHLAIEESRNYDTGGLRTVTGRAVPPPGVVDDDIWEQAAPTHSYMLIALNGSTSDMETALTVAKRGIDKWRSILNDEWNVAGIATTNSSSWPPINGVSHVNQPLVTSHYGFLLVDYYLVPLLSGQQAALHQGTLSFNPPFSQKCPFAYPLSLAGTVGRVSCDSTGVYNVSIAFGTLELPAGGLSVNGKAYPQVVSLGKGESVSW